MVATHLQSRARNIVFTAICVFNVVLAAALSFLAAHVVLKTPLSRRLEPVVDPYEFESLLVSGGAAEAVLALLAAIGYLVSIDIYRPRRPYGRLYLLGLTLLAIPLTGALAAGKDEFLVWVGAGLALLVPAVLLGVEALFGAVLLGLGRLACRKEWWELASIALRQGLRLNGASPAARRDFGMTLRTLGDTKTARSMLEPLYEAGVRDEAMVRALAEIALAEEDWDNAVRRLASLHELLPEDRDVLFRLAHALAAAADFAAARERIQRVPLEELPPPVLALLERCVSELGDIDGALEAVAFRARSLSYEKARDRYARLTEAFPGEIRVIETIVELARERDNPEEEARWLEQVVEARPDDWGAVRRLADLYQRLNRPHLEMERLRRLVTERDAPEADEILRYCRGLADEEEHRTGLDIIERHAPRFPDDPRFDAARARHHLGLGELDTANEEIQRALAQEDTPEIGVVRALAGKIDHALRRRDLEAARRAFEAEPGNIDIRLAFIEQLISNNLSDDAVRELNCLLTEHPELKARVQEEAIRYTERTESPFLVLSYLSDLALKDADYDRALDLYHAMAERSLHPDEIVGEGCRRILQLHPEYLPARSMLGRFHAARGEWGRVVEVMTEYFRNGGEHTEEIDGYMFQAALAHGDLEEGVEYGRRLVESDPHAVEPLVGLATLYEQNERLRDAADALRRALEIDSRNLELYNRLRRLDARIKEERYYELKDEIERSPEDVERHLEMGDLYMYREEYILAVKHYQVVARKDEYANLAFAKQAACLAHRRLFDLAREQLAKVVLDPVSDPHAREVKRLLYVVASLLEHDKRIDEAFKIYKEVFLVDAGYRDVAAKIERYSSGRK